MANNWLPHFRPQSPQDAAVFEKNDLRNNTRGAWDIAEDSKALVTRRGNVE